MNLSFLGAAKTVTGSCFMIETKNKKVLIDCGMFQGHTIEHELNAEPFPFSPADIDYLLLTHAHIDHSGRIPKLCMEGFKGEIITTKATAELCELMLPDSGHIQETETAWLNQKRERANKNLFKPLYTMQDAINSLKFFTKIRYDEEISLGDSIRVIFRDAGHILGSAILEIWITEDGKETKIVFSGDLGNLNTPILRDPTIIDDADYLVLESTYGDRLHEEKKDKVEHFMDILVNTIRNNGNVIIPSFAVGRTQEIIYDLHKEKEKYAHTIRDLHGIPVYIDSPLAVSATEVFRNNLDCYDEEAREYIRNGDNPLDFPELHFTRSSEESKTLNEKDENMVIISASGMCEAGRIKHHLKFNLWKPQNTVLFVGYQAQGTLGRKILEGARKVKIFGDEINIKARIESIDGFSGHADKAGIHQWLSKFTKKPQKIFIVHGEPEVQEILAKEITENFQVDCIIPGRGSTFEIIGTQLAKSQPIIHEIKPTFMRLAVLDQLDKLKEEFEDLADMLKGDLKKETNEEEVLRMKARLETLEKSILNVLRYSNG
jgi:metallo-beta-lactamase family protein